MSMVSKMHWILTLMVLTGSDTSIEDHILTHHSNGSAVLLNAIIPGVKVGFYLISTF